MEDHDVQAAGDLLGIAISKRLQIGQLLFFSAVHELIVHTALIHDLDGPDRHGADGGVTGGLLSAFTNDGHISVQGEGHHIDAGEGQRSLTGQLRDGAVSGNLGKQFSYQFTGKKGSSNKRCHVIYLLNSNWTAYPSGQPS